MLYHNFKTSITQLPAPSLFKEICQNRWELICADFNVNGLIAPDRRPASTALLPPCLFSRTVRHVLRGLRRAAVSCAVTRPAQCHAVAGSQCRTRSCAGSSHTETRGHTGINTKVAQRKDSRFFFSLSLALYQFMTGPFCVDPADSARGRRLSASPLLTSPLSN